VQRFINYPNPFTSKTTFLFEHNQIGHPIKSQLQIMTITGKVVQQFEKNITPTTNLVSIDWDGRDEFGDQLGKGVYVYRLIVTNNNNEIVEKIEKLILL
jgi:flagellar hook assembly protein FlgD